MPEILTESFCERCGTRYTFESAAPRVRRIGKIRTLSKGLKNFVMSDGTSLDEALAAARSDTEREAVSQQLDAFHKAFNFCMTCRQYTCSNCWSDADGRCLTCAPQAGREALDLGLPPLAQAAQTAEAAPIPFAEADGNGALAEPQAPWPMPQAAGTEPSGSLDAWPEAPADAGWAEAELQPDEIAQRLAMLGGSPPEAVA
jgi:hypothetical protein